MKTCSGTTVSTTTRVLCNQQQQQQQRDRPPTTQPQQRPYAPIARWIQVQPKSYTPGMGFSTDFFHNERSILNHKLQVLKLRDVMEKRLFLAVIRIGWVFEVTYKHVLGDNIQKPLVSHLFLLFWQIFNFNLPLAEFFYYCLVVA